MTQRFAELKAQGVGVAIVDAVDNEDLMRLTNDCDRWKRAVAILSEPDVSIDVGLPG